MTGNAAPDDSEQVHANLLTSEELPDHWTPGGVVYSEILTDEATP